MSLKSALVNALISEDITKLESAFDSIVEKAESATPILAAEIQLEVSKAKLIFAQYKPNAEREISKVADEVTVARCVLDAALAAAAAVEKQAVTPAPKKSVRKKKSI